MSTGAIAALANETSDPQADAAVAGTPAVAQGAAVPLGLVPETDIKPVPTVLTKLDKWGDYESCATGPVLPTLFIPMKTPLSRALVAGWKQNQPPAHPWTIDHLLDTQAAAGRRVGLIMDLSNHDTLYAEDLPACLEYRHIQLVAKMLPSQETVDEVIREAQAFWQAHPDLYIAIHCAYGFNRTGFIMCSYLCEAEGMTVDEALDSFAAVRAPGVKHEKFIEELYRRYHSEGPTFAAAAAAARSVTPCSTDPAEPCLPPTPSACTNGQVTLTHHDQDAVGNGTELAMAPSESALQQVGRERSSSGQPSRSTPQHDGVSHISRSTLAAVGSIAGGVASLPGRLLRGGIQGHAATAADGAAERGEPLRAPLTESVLAAKDASPAGHATPARPAAWEARLMAAQEGADGEDNESLGGSSNQLARPSQLAALSWGAPAREPSQSFSSRLARIPGPAGDGDVAADALAECDGCAGANGPAVSMPESGDHRASGGGAAAGDGTAEPSAPPRAQAAAAPGPGRLGDCEELPDSAAAAGYAIRRSSDAPRQPPPSVSDSVSTVPASHGRKGSIHDHRGRRHCCVM